jgi:hypothetical protein
MLLQYLGYESKLPTQNSEEPYLLIPNENKVVVAHTAASNWVFFTILVMIEILKIRFVIEFLQSRYIIYHYK